MTPLRVAFLADHLVALAGTEASLVGAAVGVRRAGHDVIVGVYSVEGPPHQYWLDALADAGIEVFTPVLQPDADVSPWVDFCSQAERVLRDWRPDVVHVIPLSEIAQTWATGGFLPGVPKVGTENSEASARCTWYDTEEFPRLQSFDALIAPCATVGKGIRDYFGFRGRIAVLPHPMLIPERELTAPEPLDLSRRADLGSISRFTVEKGPEFMIAALALLARTHDAATLTIYGHTAESGRALEVAQALEVEDRLFLPGAFKDAAEISGIVNRHCIFVLGSLFESLPMALLHVAARGRVTVSTRVGGVAEFMDRAGSPLMVPAMARGSPRADRRRRQKSGRVVRPGIPARDRRRTNGAALSRPGVRGPRYDAPRGGSRSASRLTFTIASAIASV